METVILTVHLILAALLIGVVLLQRSEGGGLGMGGGGGGVMSGRQAANALTKLTWILAIGFIITSISLTVIAARSVAGSSVMDRVGNTLPAPATEVPQGTTTLPTMPDINALPQSAPAPAPTPVEAPVQEPAAPAAGAPAPVEQPASGN